MTSLSRQKQKANGRQKSLSKPIETSSWVFIEYQRVSVLGHLTQISSAKAEIEIPSDRKIESGTLVLYSSNGRCLRIPFEVIGKTRWDNNLDLSHANTRSIKIKFKKVAKGLNLDFIE